MNRLTPLFLLGLLTILILGACGEDETNSSNGTLISQGQSSSKSAADTQEQSSSRSISSNQGLSSSRSSSSQEQSSSQSFGALEAVLVELFEGGVPPAEWSKLGIYSESDSGYSCTLEGLPDGGTGCKLSGSKDETSWIATPDISALGAIAVSFWYRGGLDYTGSDLGLKTEASSDGNTWTLIGKAKSALASFTRAGPYAIPAGTKFVRVWYLKHANYNVTIDAFALFKAAD